MEPTVQNGRPSTEPLPGDIVQIYAPKAMGRIGVVRKVAGEKAEVWVQGKGVVTVEVRRMLPVHQDVKGEEPTDDDEDDSGAR